MLLKHKLLRDAAVLTSAGIISRLLGFFFRIFLSRSFGEESVGLYQMIFPLYVLCISISTSGLQTAISRITAEKTALGQKNKAENVLKSALCLAVGITLIEIIVIQEHASFIAGTLLGDKRCQDLILIISYALPFAAIHSCISGHSLGLGSTKLPAVSQLVEQCVRILLVIALYIALSSAGLTPSIRLAAAGIVAGELAAGVFSICSHLRQNRLSNNIFSRRYISGIISSLRELIVFSMPLTANHTALTLLQSIEAASIPACLIRYGVSPSEAVSIYGVLTGMALPCILFPSALTGSIGTVLLPAVSAASTSGKRRSALLLLRKAVLSCFSLGLACCLFFLIFGDLIGQILFRSDDAGRFILALAWICPFLYANSSLLSALNGYGRTGTVFLINMVGLLIRIAGVFLVIPHYGILGYLWALLAAQLSVSLLASTALLRLNGGIRHSKETAI